MRPVPYPDGHRAGKPSRVEQKSMGLCSFVSLESLQRHSASLSVASPGTARGHDSWFRASLGTSEKEAGRLQILETRLRTL